MDHRELLKKYVDHVRQCEGISFIDRLNESMSSDVAFSADEVAELECVEREISAAQIAAVDAAREADHLR